jgi:hypothetical protein
MKILNCKRCGKKLAEIERPSRITKHGIIVYCVDCEDYVAGAVSFFEESKNVFNNTETPDFIAGLFNNRVRR